MRDNPEDRYEQMIYMVYGGSASGKSEYAENLAMSLSPSDRRFYIATMISYGKEGAARVARHRTLRQGKGFQTIECPLSIQKAAQKIPDLSEACLLIECVSNLVANEMFDPGSDEGSEKSSQEDSSFPKAEPLADRIAGQLQELCIQAKDVVLVSNNIFDEAMIYDETTRQYVQCLGQVNAAAALFADQVYEVTAGIPVRIK